MPLDPDAGREWLQFARDDLRMAGYALSDDPPMPSQACFHAQQAVEKALKGLLLAHGLAAPHTHNLLLLVDSLVIAVAGVERFAEAAAVLTRFAVSARYPDAANESLDDARWAVGQSNEIVAWSLAVLGN